MLEIRKCQIDKKLRNVLTCAKKELLLTLYIFSQPWETFWLHVYIYLINSIVVRTENGVSYGLCFGHVLVRQIFYYRHNIGVILYNLYPQQYCWFESIKFGQCWCVKLLLFLGHIFHKVYVCAVCRKHILSIVISIKLIQICKGYI